MAQVSHRSQHLRRTLLKDYAKWDAYKSEAVEDAQRTQVPLPMKKGMP